MALQRSLFAWAEKSLYGLLIAELFFSGTKQTETHPSVTDNPLLRIIFRKGECVQELQRNEKKMKDKLDDEIKLAGQESLVPEELEKHLILNSNRL